MVEKYGERSQDSLRWSLKPVFLSYLLERVANEPVAYVDPDQFFVGNPQVLFDLEPTTTMRLSPHWRPIAPASGPVFADNFKDGIFNGGLFVATADAIPALEWWATACLHSCEKSPSQGLYDDQRYLDVLPVYFEGIDWVVHKGVNVASWNRLYLERKRDPEGGVLVEGDPLVCVHFTTSTIRAIDSGEDPCLESVLKEYRRELSLHDIRLAHASDSDNPPAKTASGVAKLWKKLPFTSD
jgi:hypothetical protein